MNLLPFRFRFASVMRVKCEGHSASLVRDSWNPSVLLPLFESFTIFLNNSVPSEGAKLGITGALKRLHLRMLPGAPSPTPQNASRPTSAVSATVCFRSASVLPEFLAPGRFGIFPAPPDASRSPPRQDSSVDPSPCFRGPQSAIHVCFRFASVPLPFRFRYASKLACRVLVRVLWTEGCM